MSPPSREINGPRPAPLRIHKDSHLIHKQSSSSSPPAAACQQQQRHHPVIIYTHSPKVIHTHARDFMALVQKLTGRSPSKDEARPPPPPMPENADSKGNNNNPTHPPSAAAAHDDSSSENSGLVGDIRAGCPPLGFDRLPPNHFMPEIPLFTPNSSDFFCSPSPFYRYPEASALPPPNTAGAGSPLFIEPMKAFPERW